MVRTDAHVLPFSSARPTKYIFHGTPSLQHWGEMKWFDCETAFHFPSFQLLLSFLRQEFRLENRISGFEQKIEEVWWYLDRPSVTTDLNRKERD